MVDAQYLLACVSEECHEVGKVAIKALRFGLEDKEPGQDKTNRERLGDELADLVGTVYALEKLVGVIATHGVRVYDKQAKLELFMEYSRERGQLG